MLARPRPRTLAQTTPPSGDLGDTGTVTWAGAGGSLSCHRRVDGPGQKRPTRRGHGPSQAPSPFPTAVRERGSAPAWTRAGCSAAWSRTPAPGQDAPSVCSSQPWGGTSPACAGHRRHLEGGDSQAWGRHPGSWQAPGLGDLGEPPRGGSQGLPWSISTPRRVCDRRWRPALRVSFCVNKQELLVPNQGICVN